MNFTNYAPVSMHRKEYKKKSKSKNKKNKIIGKCKRRRKTKQTYAPISYTNNINPHIE